MMRASKKVWVTLPYLVRFFCTAQYAIVGWRHLARMAILKVYGIKN
jgi:hypothetical protein